MRDILSSVGLRPYIDPGFPIMLSYFTVAFVPTTGSGSPRTMGVG